MTEASVDPSSFRPFEVTPVHLVYVGLGFFIVLFGMFSLFIKERLYLGEAPLAAVFGIIVGPACLNLFNPSHWANNESGAPGGAITDEISLEVLRVTIALSVFAVGVELPKKYLLRHWRSIAFLLGPVMIWGWLITAAFMYALIPGLDFLNSLVVASCVTPTDPILAQAVVGGPWAEKHVPAHLRHILMCESGCNDGAAFPFLYLALFLTTNRDNTGKAIAEWFYDAWAYQIIFGTLLGALIGWAARKLMRFSERHKLVDRESFVAQYVSLAIASMGVNVLLGSDDLLAAFACGSAFAWDGWFTKQTEDSNFSSIVDLLFNVAVFIYIGALMPFRDWAGGPAEEPNTLAIWRLFVLAICVLLTKRLPIVIMLWRWIPDIKTFREAIFAGHFGPIGVGAIFIATLARTELPDHIPSPPESTNDVLALVVQPIIYFFVICSIAVHGLTIPFFAFSKNASRMTRTWSRNPSFGAFESEPGWVSRMRKRTGESLHGEEGNMTEIERVLNAQLRQIGKGAIGGEAEKELTRSDTNNGSGSGNSSSDADAQGTRRNGNAEYDGYESPEHDDPVGDDWGGEDTIEMRRYLEKQMAKKQREYVDLRQQQQNLDEVERKAREDKQQDKQEGDIGATKMLDEERGAMDRDIPKTKPEREDEKQKAQRLEEEDERKDAAGRARWGTNVSSSASSFSSRQEREHAKVRDECEEHYPKSRSWVEGDKLLIEYQKSRLSEVECHTMPIMEHERESIAASDAPAHTWAMQHAEALEHYAGLDNIKSWSPTEAMHQLVHHSIPKHYVEALTRRKKRRNSDAESKEDQDARFAALYGGMTYASARRHDEDDDDYRRPVEAEADGPQSSADTHPAHNGRSRTAQRQKDRQPRTPSPPVTGWLAPQAASTSRQRTRGNRRGGATSPKRSISPQNSPKEGSTIRFAPKEYRCASEARRRNMTKKVLSGKLAMRPSASRMSEDVVENPNQSRSSGLDFKRSASAGGLGALPNNSGSGGRRSLFSSHGGSSIGLLSIPRTLTNSSVESSNGSGSIRRPATIRQTGQGHSRSSSVQWLDLESSHDHPPHRGQSGNSFQRSSSPSRTNVDLARLGGGVSRPSSRSGSPTRSRAKQAPTDANESGVQREGDDAWQDEQTAAAGTTTPLGQAPKRRSRFGTLLSSLAGGHSPGAALDHARRQGQNSEGNTVSSEPQSRAQTPAVIVGAGEYPGGENGGILADNSTSTFSGHGNSTSGAGQDDSPDTPGASDRGVTFDV